MQFVKKNILNMAPYKVASHQVWEVTEESRKKMLKLDWNEATIPPSPKVKEYLLNFVENESNLFLYPKTVNLDLLNKLSRYTEVPVSNLQYFAGSDSLHEYLVRAMLGDGDRVLIVGPTYDNFRLTCESQGAEVHYFYYDDEFNLDESGLKKYISQIKPRILYLCNPNNPSGTLVTRKFLANLSREFSNTAFIIDEAYYEFSGETVAADVISQNNLFICRTFSKAFGIANVRAGYLISHQENIENISKIRNSKSISSFAQEAMLAVLSDVNYMHDYVREVRKTREWFIKEIGRLSYVKNIHKSEANFVLIEFESGIKKNELFKHLALNGVYVRNLEHSPRLRKSLRITVGTRKQMEIVCGVLNIE